MGDLFVKRQALSICPAAGDNKAIRKLGMIEGEERHNLDGIGDDIKIYCGNQVFCYNVCKTLNEGKRGGTLMHIGNQRLCSTLKERGIRKEDLRLAAGLTTNMIAKM